MCIYYCDFVLGILLEVGNFEMWCVGLCGGESGDVVMFLVE